MSVSPAVLLISIAIGVPLMLLALGVLYHAYVLSRQAPIDELTAHVEALATESTEDLLANLQEAVERMQGQLASQRESLAGLLSDSRAPASMPAPQAAFVAPAPMAAGEFVPAPAMRRAEAAVDQRSQIQRLAAEGLSDRAIARQLHIGLEEVRIARMRGGRS
jgi:DNA-binding NarL/FixJ family response regulator